MTYCEEDIKYIKRASEIVSETLVALEKHIRPGVTTGELNSKAEKLISDRGAQPAFKNYSYKKYPASICASVNEEVVHGIPKDEKKLRDGDIVSIDVGVMVEKNSKRYFGDAASTFAVGKISQEAERLLQVTKNALVIGVERARAKNRLTDISHAIQRYVENRGFEVVRRFVGHGIGHHLHEEPEIPNFGKPGEGIELKPGMVLAIEPMVNIGTSEVETLKDGWTAVTKDRKLSAHFEHTVYITHNGPQILTKI